ncbi:hypothetical protein N7519_001259 [Penicillium mononematosum]|uniref:uncharacterized protein n=1 Tax=Penicillium mononematosum TaxID=268346 RepID=UPI0025486508|nr:uncharacterized protein N7519_001259 [Penicillium mononematosum]KAJ6191238.1 hypothetical protein N7519_001259 [Penicillium mononematosum]
MNTIYVAAHAHRVGPVHLLDLLIDLSHGPPAVDLFADDRGVADTHPQGLNGLQVAPEPLLHGHGLDCPRVFASMNVLDNTCSCILRVMHDFLLLHNQCSSSSSPYPQLDP